MLGTSSLESEKRVPNKLATVSPGGVVPVPPATSSAVASSVVVAAVLVGASFSGKVGCGFFDVRNAHGRLRYCFFGRVSFNEAGWA